MPGRSYTSENYRFGFNGMEKDDEMKGSGNSLDFGARIYDSRLGRWFSVDPLEVKYPYLSSYSFVDNSPNFKKEIDGRYWIEFNVCYIGTCKQDQKGHNGFHLITSAKIITTDYKILYGVNLSQAIPIIGWGGVLSKGVLAIKDNSVSFGASDWAGVGLNLIGAGVGKYADDMGAFILNASRAGVSLTFAEFSRSEYFDLIIDNLAIQELANDGYGKLVDNVFTFDKQFISDLHHEVSNDIKENPNKYKTKGIFGINFEHSTNSAKNEVYNRIDNVMKEKRNSVIENIKSSFEKEED